MLHARDPNVCRTQNAKCIRRRITGSAVKSDVEEVIRRCCAYRGNMVMRSRAYVCNTHVARDCSECVIRRNGNARESPRTKPVRAATILFLDNNNNNNCSPRHRSERVDPAVLKLFGSRSPIRIILLCVRIHKPAASRKPETLTLNSYSIMMCRRFTF